MSKRIFITGAAGFIGFHLAQFLHARGDEVIGYDNFNDYYTVQLKRDRAKVLQDLGIPMAEGDICDTPLLESVMEKHTPTHVVHLAAQAGVRYSLTNPQAYVKSNLEGFVAVLEICRRFPLLKFIYASSSSVYGLNQKLPFSLEDNTDRQASLYGATKKANELMAYTYHHLYGLSVTGLRFFTVYGPWGRPDMAYFSFTKSILEGKPIDVYNFGNLQRDFTYIDDIVSGTVAAVDLGAACEVFNLGNHQPTSLSRFIECLEKALGQKAILNYLPMQSGDVYATYADISHSRDRLNFSPKTPLENGLAHFVQWYRQYFNSTL
jgi:UDP-glucuronate 4-epimerase